MNKKLMIIITFLFVIMMCVGCGPVTTITMDEEGKGSLSYKFAFEKNFIENSGYTNASNIDEFATLVKSKFDPSLGLNLTVDKESSNQEDYIIVSFEYNSIEEYNNKIISLTKASTALASGYSIYDIYGYNKEKDEKDYSTELEAFNEYLQEENIYAENNDRNTRKFIKLLKKAISVDEAYLYKLDNEDNKLKSKDEDVTITDNNGIKELNVQYMALNCLEIYFVKVIEKYKTEIFNPEYLEKNSDTITNIGYKEILKRALRTFEVASKIKSAINTKKGIESDTYSMSDFTPVMTIKLFDDETMKGFKQIYTKEYKVYRDEKKQNEGTLDLTFDELKDIYADRVTQYNINFGSNVISFTGDKLFGLYNDEGYIPVSSQQSEVLSEDLDENPYTGDKINIVFVLMLISGSMLIIVMKFYSIKKRK